MPNSVIPDSHANRLAFFKNLKQVITDNATALKLDAAALATIAALLDPIIAKYQTLVDAEVAASAASVDAEQTFNGSKEQVLALFASLRANPGLTAGLGDEMKIYSSTPEHDPATIKPKIKAVSEPGHVRITGSKDYAELVNIYLRLAGTAAWTLVGIKRKKFPFDDQTPLKVAGTPEQREYCARGVIDDEEIGLMSDIVTVVFGG